MASLFFEKDLWRRSFTRVAGVDEAGRGPLAGPVVAAAVIFSAGQKFIPGVNDSKKLSAGQRLALKPVIEGQALAIGIGVVHEAEIDAINILQAALKAMQMAVHNLALQPDFLLIDGNRPPDTPLPFSCIVKGDAKSMSIAAASIIAKVTRDDMMVEYDRLYPQYGFSRHKGYPTPKHISAIRLHGLCPVHRRSFKPKGLSLT